jgi:uncharacterized protein (DUF58 family)
MPHFFVVILWLFLIAAFFRIEFFFYLLYLLVGVHFFSRLWADRAVQGITCERRYVDRAFLGERIPVTLRIRNESIIPLLWLRIHESLPIHLKSPNFYRRVLSLLPYEERTLTYELSSLRRGYYTIGPLMLTSGDLFGVRDQTKSLATTDTLIVYPRIVALSRLGLPAQAPFGDVPSKQQIFQDPTRMIGVRRYQSGDSMRHIHWKTTAATGVLQVKRFEPAISVEAQIFLNLNRGEYTLMRVETASELAIVTAASIANYLVEQRQKVGLSCNGLDPLKEDRQSINLSPRKGRGQLMHILDLLARVQVSDHIPFATLLERATLRLTWGGTGVIISSHADDDLFANMILMKRSGFHVILALVDPRGPFKGIRQRAHEIGIDAYQIWREKDLDVWR